jgi:hypothetical protein
MRRQIIDSPPQLCVIPLDEAWFCESCRAICNNSTCGCCASAEHNHRLAPWLDHEREPISIPLSGVILSVVPDLKRHPKKENYYTPPRQLPRAS